MTTSNGKKKKQGFRIYPNSSQVDTVVISSFTRKLGNWVANHADDIFELISIDALMACDRVRPSNDYLEGKNLCPLIKLDQFDKSLHDYTLEFNCSYSYCKDERHLG